MCTGVEIALLAGAALSAGSTVQQGNDKRAQEYQEAANQRDQAKAEAERIDAAVRREVSAARAATAGSGTALDDFSTINTDEIQQLGSRDEAMTILSGNRRGRSLEAAGDMAYQASKFEAIGGLMQAGGKAYSGWKGRQGPNSGGMGGR